MTGALGSATRGTVQADSMQAASTSPCGNLYSMFAGLPTNFAYRFNLCFHLRYTTLLMKTNDLDFHLPESQIAQHPSAERDASRMLVLSRADGSMHCDVYRNVGQYLRAGDCLALNDTRVLRARLKGAKDSGGKVEVFLLHERGAGEWEALVRPSAKVKHGARVHFAGGVSAIINESTPEGHRMVQFDTAEVLSILENIGEIPLPPYIHRDTQDASDLRRYQTVYAQTPGAVAAPTAGLHITPEILAGLKAQGVNTAQLTLHVGYGTFKPVTSDDLTTHRVDAEEFDFPEASATALNETRAKGGRIISVGTTTTRVLETQYRDGAFHSGHGLTDKYIYPPYQFQAIDVLQTNFHLPKSSLLALVCAFAGTKLTLAAYNYAVREGFRFYSYGDVMLIL